MRRPKREKGATAEAKKLAKLHEKEVRTTDKYHVFATTMPDSWIDDDPDKVAEFYRVRWGIENSYKSYEQMRPRTTSRSHSVRLLLTIMPFIFCNIWTLARFMEARRAGVHNGGDGPPPAVHAEPFHDDDGARGGRAVGRTWRASA